MAELTESRLCTACNLVTTESECPICPSKTVPHPELKSMGKTGYCVDCGGEFPVADIVVKTWHDDPYEQCDDGMLITQCRNCENEERILDGE